MPTARMLSVVALALLMSGECLHAQTSSLRVDGKQRTFMVDRPRGATPRPTVIVLHGLGGDGRSVAEKLGLADIGRQEGFVSVFPNGSGREWKFLPAGAGSRVQGQASGSDDVNFIKALVADLIKRGSADPKRIYLVGVSNGGFMALRMACEAPELFAAVGVVLSSMPEASGRQCRPSQPVPMIVMNGTADPIIPYNGGTTPNGMRLWGTDQMLTLFRNLNGCAAAPQRSSLPPQDPRDMTRVVVESWQTCSQAPIVLYRVHDGGHRIPGRAGGGRVTSAFDAADALWNFFRDKTASGPVAGR